MATIGTVQLRIEMDGSDTSRVTVEYSIHFTEVDVAVNAEYRERVQLWGRDTPPADPNDLLTTLRNTTIRPNGQATVPRSVSRMVANGVLNEDALRDRQDELFARVMVSHPQLGSNERNSRVISPFANELPLQQA